MARKKHIKRKKAVTKTKSSSKSIHRKPILENLLPLKFKLLTASLLAIMAMALFARSYPYDFVYDDDAVIKNNRYVQNGVEGLKNIWTTSYFDGFNQNLRVNAFRPVPLSTFALEYQQFGLNASVNHASNILLYGLTAFFLFLFLASLLRQHHFILPLMTTLFFILHPLHVEVVANIKSRDELLAFLNFAIAAWLLLNYLDNRKVWVLFLSLLFYSIALFSKESAVTTIAILPAMLYFFRKMQVKKIANLTGIYLIPVVCFLITRRLVIGPASATHKLTYLDNSLLAANGISERIASTILSSGNYLLKTVFPHPLASDYSYSTLPLVGWDDYRVYLSLLAFAALTCLLIKGLHNKKVYSFAILYFLLAVSIFLSILFPGFSVYNDRFLYNPVLGICLLVSWGIFQLVKTKKEGRKIKGFVSFVKANPLPLAIAAFLSCAAILKVENRLPDWKDRYVLFEKDVKLVPKNARMLKNYGGSLARLAVQNQTSNPDLAREHARQAVKELEASLSIYNRIATGHIHLGIAYTVLGQYSEAEKAFKDALSIDSGSHYAKVNLANVFYRTGRFQEVINLLEGMPRTSFTKNEYYLLYLAYQQTGDAQNTEKYRKLSGR